MDEVLPGVLHWTSFHEGIGQPVHSHFYVEGAALFDPRVPDGDDGLEDVARHGRPDVVLLSNRHHLRQSACFAKRFASAIKVHRAGLHEFAAGDDPDVVPFDFGDAVAPSVTALEVGALTPEETAFHIATGDGVLLFADALIRGDDGELSYVPDGLMGDDPAAVRAGLTDALERLVERGGFDALLFAHGDPLPKGGHERLAAFVATQRRAAP